MTFVWVVLPSRAGDICRKSNENIVDWELNYFSISFLRTQLFFWIHFSPWPSFWLHFCDSTIVDWHPRVLLMFEKHLISLNWAIYDAASLIKSLINDWKDYFKLEENFWSFLIKLTVNYTIQRYETIFKHHKSPTMPFFKCAVTEVRSEAASRRKVTLEKSWDLRNILRSQKKFWVLEKKNEIEKSFNSQSTISKKSNVMNI